MTLQQILDVLKSLFKGSEVDIKKKTATLNIPGIVKIKNIPIGQVEALTKDPRLVEGVLTKCFSDRLVNFVRLEMEGFEYCKISLAECEKSLETTLDKLSKSKREEDQLLAQLVQAWKTECVTAAKALRAAETLEKQSRATEFDSSDVLKKEDKLPDILCDYRRRSYPCVQAIMDLLPDGNAVKQAATVRMDEGKNTLVRFYGMSIGEILQPSWELEASGDAEKALPSPQTKPVPAQKELPAPAQKKLPAPSKKAKK